MSRLEIERDGLDLALNRLVRLRGMLGAVLYLMGGQYGPLECPLEDFEVWFSDTYDALNEAIMHINDAMQSPRVDSEERRS